MKLKNDNPTASNGKREKKSKKSGTNRDLSRVSAAQFMEQDFDSGSEEEDATKGRYCLG